MAPLISNKLNERTNMRRPYRYLAVLETQTIDGRDSIEFSEDGSQESDDLMLNMDLWWTVGAAGRGDFLHEKGSDKHRISFTLPKAGSYSGQDARFEYEGTRALRRGDKLSEGGFVVVARLVVSGDRAPALRYSIRKVSMSGKEIEERRGQPQKQKVKLSLRRPFSGPVPEVFADELAGLDHFLKLREAELSEERFAIISIEHDFLENAMKSAVDMDTLMAEQHEKLHEQHLWTGPLRRDFIVETLAQSIESFYRRMRDSTVFTADELKAAGERFQKAFTFYVEDVLKQLEEQYPGQIRTGEYAVEAPPEPLTPPSTEKDKLRIDKAQKRLAKERDEVLLLETSGKGKSLLQRDAEEEIEFYNKQAALKAQKKKQQQKSGRERELADLLEAAGKGKRDAEQEAVVYNKKQAELDVKTPTPPGARRKKMRPLTPEERGAIDALISPEKRAIVAAAISKQAAECVQKIVTMITPISNACASEQCAVIGCDYRCKRCKKASYCSASCQAHDWKARHHKLCVSNQ
jgi:MYND finger protein